MEEKSFLSIQNGIRADVFVAEKTGFTRSYVKKLFEEQYVSINNKIAKGNKKLKEGDKIVLLIPENMILCIIRHFLLHVVLLHRIFPMPF